jgi:two-component sensor histidine kinase
MSSTPGNDTPVIEPKPSEQDQPPVSLAHNQRIRQQEILAELGVTALQGASFDELLSETARRTAEGLRAEFCKILEHVPAENRLLVRAGVGWGPDVVGVASVGADLASPAGFALRTGKPVISNHLENEERFRTPEILARHGIRRAMNVILQGDGKPYGVLEVDSRSEDEFVERDIAFLQGAANILGMAIERERHERSLKAALARQQLLLKELAHRVKNSLTIVAAMLRLQASAVGDPVLTQHLEEASYRVLAVAKAHERIHQGDDIETVDLGTYIEHICQDLDSAVAHRNIAVDAQHGIIVETDRAISLALVANELITNAAKYAYHGRPDGKVHVRVRQANDGNVELSVRDEGDGLPQGFDIRKAKGLGMRIINALSQQLHARIEVNRLQPGTEFVVCVPLRPRA